MAVAGMVQLSVLYLIRVSNNAVVRK